MKIVSLIGGNGVKVRRIRVPSIRTGAGRAALLTEFANDPNLQYVETNVRRYTASDIYAGRLGQAI